MGGRVFIRAVRTVTLAAAIGALIGVAAGAEHPDQRSLVMGLTAGVGLVTGVFLVLIPPVRRDG